VTLPVHLPTGTTLFLSAVDVQEGQLVATGSRTLAIVSIAANIAEAEATCEKIASQVEGPFFHRTDIGKAELLERRVAHMKALRSA
jgi:phosphoribosylamine-glycine ligase